MTMRPTPEDARLLRLPVGNFIAWKSVWNSWCGPTLGSQLGTTSSNFSPDHHERKSPIHEVHQAHCKPGPAANRPAVRTTDQGCPRRSAVSWFILRGGSG